VFPPKRSQAQIQRGVGYVYLRRLYQSNCWVEGVPCPTNKGVSYTKLVSSLAVALKIDYYYYYCDELSSEISMAVYRSDWAKCRLNLQIRDFVGLKFEDGLCLNSPKHGDSLKHYTCFHKIL